MRFWLSPHVRAVSVADDIVFLDIAADAYLCLAGASAWLRLNGDGTLEAAPPEAARDLLEAGLLAGDGPRPLPRMAPAIAGDLSLEIAPLAVRRTPLALATNRRAARAIARLPFQAILSLAGPQHDEAFAAPGAGLRREAGRFARLSPWLPHAGLCLMRSLQQRLYLSRLGLPTSWVFGVRTWPFEAHCWLQAGDLVLDDTAEHAAAFTPIMVL